ncbi:MAG: hypothetical protein HW387_1111 [Parachlamydiales bacterium]|nr:hypothetical protein [Parachlamydiales bacterium]
MPDLNSDPDPPVWINYFYFGSLFAMMILLSISGNLVREDLGGSQIFFLLYSIGEATLEVVLFIFCGWLIRRYLSKVWFHLYIGLTFICLFLHLIDFMMDRLINFTIWETFEFVFDETFDNFLHLLIATGLPIWVWLCIFGSLATIPFMGIFIYWVTDWLANKKPLGVRLSLFLQAFFCIPVALFLWDFSASRFLHREVHHSYIKSLPWKVTFLHPRSPTLHLSHSLARPKTQEQIDALIDQFPYTLEHKPNIYLFVAEALRDDAIVPEIAPFLSQFKNRNLHGKLSLSNANATQISWFSIFHSNFPFYWNIVKHQRGPSGSPALQLLKKLGYEIRVYTSADLDYYGMNELLFGKNGRLASEIKYFPHTAPKEAWQSDEQTINAFASDLANNEHYRQGQCFVFFWDSTHYEYSWPKEKTLFRPVSGAMNYFRAYHSRENIDSIRNAYKNALHNLDDLFGHFLSIVPDRDNALIGITGDHGEEFFEHGHLFHGSHLSDVQTQIPILLQLPRPCATPELLTQMDIFPSFIDALTADGATAQLLEGQSVYSNNRWPFAIISRFNASRTPCEFCIHSGKHKLIARFGNHRNIFRSKFLKILSLRTCRDRVFDDCKKDLNSWIRREFGDALEKIFPAKENQFLDN